MTETPREPSGDARRLLEKLTNAVDILREARAGKPTPSRMAQISMGVATVSIEEVIAALSPEAQPDILQLSVTIDPYTGEPLYDAAAEAVPSVAPAVLDLAQHLTRQRDFSERTFGPGARTAGVVDHICKELREIEAKPHDLSEWIDVVILAFDGAWRAGYGSQEIVAALIVKQGRNEERQWPDWRTQPPDKAIEHVRAEAVPSAPAGLSILDIVSRLRSWQTCGNDGLAGDLEEAAATIERLRARAEDTQ